MTWHSFGVNGLNFIRPKVTGLTTEATTGEPAYECGETILAAWISSITPTPGETNCTYTPRVTWTFRLHHCTNPDTPGDQAETWHNLLTAVWCALTDFLLAICENCPSTFDGVNIPPPSGLQIIADLTVTVEETCPNDN